MEHRDGSDPAAIHKLPGLTRFEPITIERGLTHDPEFEQWANLVWDLQTGEPGSLRNFRKDMILELYNEAGQIVFAYKIFRCWPSEVQMLPELDANGSGIAIQSMKIENEGWERDVAVVEPQET